MQTFNTVTHASVIAVMTMRDSNVHR